MLNAIAIVILAAMMLIPLVNIFVGVVVGSRLGGVLGAMVGSLLAVAITVAEKLLADRRGWPHTRYEFDRPEEVTSPTRRNARY
jgi:predicted PurR-regulated permease PerM